MGEKPSVPEIGKEGGQDTDQDVAVTIDRQGQAVEAVDEDPGQEVADSAAEDKPKDFGFMVGDKTLREHIDPAGAGAGVPDETKEPFERQDRLGDVARTVGVDRLDELPAGEELVKPEDDKRSRAERARQKLYESESLENVHDITGKTGDSLQNLFGPKSPGHPETRVARPVYAPEHHEGIDAGDVATALLVVGVMTGEGLRVLMGHSRRRREGPDNAGNR